MTEDIKPLKWTPPPEAGFQVTRRSDGGMNVVFTAISAAGLKEWRRFALAHLEESDRLTRNLYDLRQLRELPEAAVRVAVEVNNDPSSRHIRLAVLVANEQVRRAVQEIALLTRPGGVEMAIFEDPAEAEAWLTRPLTLLV